MVKLYHWKTHSYSEHKATDELYENLGNNIDKFVEVLMGKDQKRIKMMESRIQLIDIKNTKEFKSRILQYSTFFTRMDVYLDSRKDSDLLSIRDDILANINQFLYLLSMNK
jgi:DNA-binding ferritin-like protein